MLAINTEKTMKKRYETPQDAEDAFYDALEEGDLWALMSTWEDSNDTTCLLPMQSIARGREQIEQAFRPLLDGGRKVALSVTHIQWIEAGDLVVHLLKETAEPPPGQPDQSIYAINIFRRSRAGWRLLMHQNSPTPPPPGAMPSAAP